VAVGDTMGNARARIAESLDESRELDAEIAAWHARWDESYAISRYRTQLNLIAAVTRNLIGEFIGAIGQINPAGDTGEVYAKCREADERLHYVRKLWRYYADKFDQRAGSEDDVGTRTLLAADEVIWSCWKTALKNMGVPPEFYAPAPLSYLSPQFAASTTHRTGYPADLGREFYRVFDDHVGQLPVPVIALPPGCQRRPWGLVAAAHEVGHHVQWAVPGVEERTRAAVTAAVRGSLATRWEGWHEELFADTCAVLLTGPAVIWAISEVETRPATAAGTFQHPCYPPPPVRLAMVRAVAERAGLFDPIFAEAAADEVPAPVPGEDKDTAELLGFVPAVAGALLGVTSDSGAELRGLATATARAYGDGVIRDWAEALLEPYAPAPKRNLGAARFCVAGSVAAWQSIVSRAASDEELAAGTAFLAGQVRGVLPDCAEPGTRAAAPGTDIEVQAEELARRFWADLSAIDLAAADQFAAASPKGGAGRP
jgi:hypothetical protein